ncbi:MAG: putative toxin-antitoxin system toxin component, PIN family [Planctomycetes bacterium]|nr:putative toxin-antitoxin system toxin component, PIN family [Planctomycetota bacterium]
MRIVLDTNVFISGMLRPHSTSANLLRLILQGSVDLLVDERILQEYEEVALRPKFKIPQKDLQQVLEQIRVRGEKILTEPMAISVPDKDDLPFLEVALWGKAEGIVTGNKKHFPLTHRGAVAVWSPTETLEKLARKES